MGGKNEEAFSFNKFWSVRKQRDRRQQEKCGDRDQGKVFWFFLFICNMG